MADAAGAILLRAGVLGPQSLAAAASAKQRDGGTLGEALVRLGLIEEDRLVQVFAESLQVPTLGPAQLGAAAGLLELLPPELLHRHGVLPVEVDGEGNLTLAMADPSDNRAVDDVATHTGRFVLRAVAAPSAIRQALTTYDGATLSKSKTDKASPVRAASGPNDRSMKKTNPKIKADKAPQPLSALARAVAQADPPEPAREPAEEGAELQKPQESKAARARGRRNSSPRVSATGVRPSTLSGSGPVVLERPVRTGTAGATLPGTGAQADLLAPVARLRAAGSRDEVVEILLDYTGKLAARAGLFVVQKGQLVCLDGRGPESVVVAMKWVSIGTDEPSPFRDVLLSKAPYIGQLDDTPESRSFRSALGSGNGPLLLLPLILGERAVGVLYADELLSDLNKLSVELETLSREAGAAFARIILSRKAT